MKRLLLLALLLSAAAAAYLRAPGCGGGPAPASRARGVVLVLVDTLRPDHLGAYGYDRPTSPHIDALARQGALFEVAVAQAPWTTPSIASLLSGLRPDAMNLGRFSDPGRVGDAVETLAERLHAAGFRTFAVTEGGSTRPDFGFDQGFETYDAEGGYLEKTFQKARAFLDGLGPDERFFLFVHTYDVHNYNPPKRFRERFGVPYQGGLLPQRRLARYLQSGGHGDEVRRFGAAEWTHIRSLYDACIAHTDEAIGGLLEHLRRLGRLDDTLLIVTADHGEEFGEHGRSGHGYQLFEETIRVPLVLRGPGVTPRRVARPVRLLDLAPTIAEWTGVEPWERWQGRSLGPLLRGEDAPSPPSVTACAHGVLAALRGERYKLIAGAAEPPLRLFDLARDPEERENLASSPRAAEVLARWRRELLRRIREDRGLADRFGEARTGPSEATRREMEALGYLGGAERRVLSDAEFDWEGLLGGAR